MSKTSDQELKSIFRKGSTTYFFSSMFFPKNIRQKVFELYAYVRIIDDFVDSTPQDSKSFFEWKLATFEALKTGKSQNRVITDFVALSNQYFEKEWVEAFLASMEADLKVSKYKTFSDLEKYIYGSAEVIGLMMAKIMNLPEESFEAAKSLGKAMQLLNFIRDINEDLDLGRAYLPEQDLIKFNITNLTEIRNGSKDNDDFEKFIRFEINRFFEIMKEAEKGFHYIPRQLRIAIRTASNMHKWTGRQIYNDPYIIFSKKVKPSKKRIFTNAALNYIYP